MGRHFRPILAFLAVLLLFALPLSSGCTTTDPDNGGDTAGEAAGDGGGAEAGDTDSGGTSGKAGGADTPEKKQIMDLLLTFRDTDRWKQSRQALYEMGPAAHQPMFRFLFRMLMQEPYPAELRRIEREYARALRETRFAPGAEPLVLVAVNKKAGQGRNHETLRAAVISICGQAGDVVLLRVNEEGETEEVPLRQMLRNVYLNLWTEKLPADKPRRDQLVTARITIIKMLAAAGGSDEGLHLLEFMGQLEALDEWLPRGRFIEGMENFRGEESMRVLERGVGDSDDNVRSIANDVVQRRRRLERRRQREAERRKRSGGRK